jgi:hypothetical protein
MWKKNYGNVGSKSIVDLTKGCVKFDTDVTTNINLVCHMGFNNLIQILFCLIKNPFQSTITFENLEINKFLKVFFKSLKLSLFQILNKLSL